MRKALRAFKDIKPPGASYAEWHRFLAECAEARTGPLAVALRRREAWLTDAEARDIPYDQAELEFSASMERNGGAVVAAERERAQQLAKVAKENGRDDVYDQAGEVLDCE